MSAGLTEQERQNGVVAGLGLAAEGLNRWLRNAAENGLKVELAINHDFTRVMSDAHPADQISFKVWQQVGGDGC